MGMIIDFYWNHLLKSGADDPPLVQPSNYYYFGCANQPTSKDPAALRADINRFLSDLHGTRLLIYQQSLHCEAPNPAAMPRSLRVDRFEYHLAFDDNCITVIDNVHRWPL